MTTTIARPHVPGIRVEFDKVKAAKGQALCWALWVEKKLPGVKERLRVPKFFATEEEAWAEFPKVEKWLADQVAHATLQLQLKRGLKVPALPQAPEGVELFQSMALRWLEEEIAYPKQKASTHDGYLSILTNHLFPIMGTWPVADEVMSVQRMTQLLGKDLYARKVGIKRRLDAQAVLSVFFNYALTQLPAKVLSHNPAKGLGRKRLTQPDEWEIELEKIPNPMERDQLDAFLAWQKAHSHPTLYRLFVWLAYQGSRLGEALALQWDVSRIDLVAETAHIKQTFSQAQRKLEIQAERQQRKGREGRGLQKTKTSRADQFIRLQPIVVDELHLQKQDNLAHWMRLGRYGAEPTFVFLNATDCNPLRKGDRINDAFHAGCEALGLVGKDTGKPFVIHDLRATFITLSILAGHDIRFIARTVGHKGTGTIEKHYFRYLDQAAENPFRRVQR